MDPNDRAAVRAVLAGDRNAYGDLVIRHSSRLFRLAYRMVGSEADADDVVQDTFLRGYLNLAKFEYRSNFSTWIYRIAVRCALDRLAARRARPTESIDDSETDRQGAFDVPDAAPGPERLALSVELGDLRRRAMSGLTDMERTAFVLRHMEEHSTEEIAQALDVAPNTARQTVFRAVQKVRKKLEEMKVMV